MMKKLLCLLSISLLVIACQAPQEKQYFTESPEIDLAKAGNEAYLNGDWETLRSYFADTAVVYTNTWLDEEAQTVDEYIAELQENVSSFSSRSISDDAVWEMVINEEGHRWVHAWFNWTGTHNNGTEVQTVVHISWRVESNKVVWMGVLFDSLPFYLAENPPQPADTVETESEE